MFGYYDPITSNYLSNNVVIPDDMTAVPADYSDAEHYYGLYDLLANTYSGFKKDEYESMFTLTMRSYRESAVTILMRD